MIEIPIARSKVWHGLFGQVHSLFEQRFLRGEQKTPGKLAGGVIETSVDGEFTGWEGETIIKLLNGQIWQQSRPYYSYHYAFNPTVIIYPSGGVIKMKVDGVDEAVPVELLRK